MHRRPSNREVEHVPAYSHSNRWVGVGGACSDKWIVIGEIRGSQGNRNYRRGPVRLAQRFSNESVAAATAKEAGVPCDMMHVENARPYQAIIAAASDRGCDLIVMASHGAAGWPQS